MRSRGVPIPCPYRYESLRRSRGWVASLKRLLLWLQLARFADRWRAWGRNMAPPEDLPFTQRRLNLGCGPANYRGYINLDVAPSPHLHVRASGEDLPFASESLDEVLCADVIEHLDAGDGRRLLAEVGRVLRPGGRLILITPDLDALVRAYRGRLASHDRVVQHLLGDARDHRYLYTVGILTRGLNASGLTVRRTIRHWGPVWAHMVLLVEKR